MKRWLSLIKRHVTPGQWAKPAKKRRPVTYAPPTLSRDTYVSVSPATTAPLVPKRNRPRTLCDTNIILDLYYNAPPIVRVSSQTLPLSDLPIDRDSYREYAFIHFEPTYTVTVSELNPYQLALRKPRPARFSARVVSFFTGEKDGEI